MTAALCVLVRRILPLARSDGSVAAGALAVPLLLGVVTALALPAFSYVFAWPTLAAIVLLGWTILRSSAAHRTWPSLVGLSVPALGDSHRLVALAAVCPSRTAHRHPVRCRHTTAGLIQYSLDADTGQGTWLSAGSRPDDWTRQFFAHGYAAGRRADDRSSCNCRLR